MMGAFQKNFIAIVLVLALLGSLDQQVEASDVLVQSAVPTIVFDDTSLPGTEWSMHGDTVAFDVYNPATGYYPLSIFPTTPVNLMVSSVGFGLLNNGSNAIFAFEAGAPGSLAVPSSGDINLAQGRFYFDRDLVRLGIGTSVPSWDLEIQSSSPGIWFDDTSGSSADWWIGNVDNDFHLGILSPNGTGGPTGPLMVLDAQTGNVGLGNDNPARQLHLVGPNATFRMDRSYDTAAFLMVRTDGGGTPWKTFVVGTNAAGSNNGEFIINDLGTAVSGGGARRMTIQNNGDVVFTGNLFAAAVNPVSSIRFKENVEPIADPLALAQKLQGVRFDWKDSGKPSIGLIAEDVERVLPEVVARDSATGEVAGLNYNAIVPVLLEALKAQQANFEVQQQQITDLEQQVSEYQSVQARLAELEAMVIGRQSEAVLVSNR